MERHIKWFKGLSYRTQWNLSINYINHLDNLTGEEILQIYNEQNPPLKKLIKIKTEDIKPLKQLAIKENKDLENYIQDLLSEHVRENNCNSKNT